LSGYSGLAEVLDPEDLQEVVGKIFREATKIITSYEGIIEKFIGDAIVAIFGVGKTHEDDAVRAILSALDLHSIVEKSGKILVPLIDKDLCMHSGINTGEVFVGSTGADPFNHGALGAPINIASRLSDMARPGEILIGDSLVFEARRFFQLEYLGKRRLKGFRENSGVYRVVSPRQTPLALHRDRGRIAQMIGRENQLKALDRAARDVRNQNGSIVCISGDPGVGKSRLLQEFKNVIAGDMPWFETRCFAFAKDSPYFPFSVLIRQMLGLEGQGLSFQKVKAKIVSIMNSELFASLLASLCCDEFGNGETQPDVWKSKLFDAVSSLLHSFAFKQPIIICFEDIHWADQSTLDLLRYLVNYPQTPYPCLFLISFRSQPSFALPGMVIHLKDLSNQQSKAMAESLIPDQKPNTDTIEYLFNATGGNPFYLEEMVNYLIDRGSSLNSETFFKNGGKIPTTITGLITARLDNLSPTSRCVIQKASVIGRVFLGSLLCSISSAPEHVSSALDELVEAGFINALGRDEYTFRHALTQEVSYASMLKRERKLIHKNLGVEIEDRYRQNLDSACDVLAYHFSRSPDEKRAIRYSILAAQKSQNAGSWVEAAEHYRIADNILQRQHDDSKDRQNMLISVWEGIWNCTRIFNPDKAIYALERLVQYYSTEKEEKAEAFARIRLINLYSQKGLFDQAREAFSSAVSLVENDQILRAAAETAVAYTYTYLGQPCMALDYLENSRRVFKPQDTFFLAVNCLSTLTAWVWKGNTTKALRWYRKTKEVSGNYVDLDLMADLWLGYIKYLKGDFSQGMRLFSKVYQAEQKLGVSAGGLSYIRIQSSIYFNTRYMGNPGVARQDLNSFQKLSEQVQVKGSEELTNLYRAWILLEESQFGQARDLLEMALPGLQAGIANRVPYALNALAEALLMQGCLEEAKKIAERGVAWNLQNQNQDQLIWAYTIMGRICISAQEYDNARKFLMQAFRLAKTCEMNPHRAWTFAAWGKLWEQRGNRSNAQACFSKAAHLWSAMGNQHQITRLTSR